MKQFVFAKIREFREAAGMTQEALAIAMSTPDKRVHTEQVSNWENLTNGGLTVTTLIKLCDALGRVPDDFFTEGGK